MFNIEEVATMETEDGLLRAVRVRVSIDGLIMDHVFPADTLEWRIAEYGLDPNDLDTVLDVVLAEPWLNDGVDHSHPRFLYNAASVEDARAFHLERVQAFQAKHAPAGKAATRPDQGGHRKAILDKVLIDPEVVEAKRGLVGVARDRHAKEKAAQGVTASRAQHWQDQLEMATKGKVDNAISKHND